MGKSSLKSEDVDLPAVLVCSHGNQFICLFLFFPGFYCPVGSAYPQPCAAGTFCNQTGLDAPLGPCDAGYYCPAGSKYSYASLCPPGHYCPPGTPAPLPCPIGTVQSEIEKYSIITVMSFMSVKVYNSINYV